MHALNGNMPVAAKRTWHLSVQPPGKRRAGCRACRAAMEVGEVRFTPAKYATCRSWYYHQGCVEDPSARLEAQLVGLQTLTPEQRQTVRDGLDDAGAGAAPAAAAAAGAEMAATPPAAAGAQAPQLPVAAEPDDEDLEERFENNGLRHLDYWDRFDWAVTATRQIGTMAEIPATMRHSVMEAKAEVLKKAGRPDGAQNQECTQAWKLLCVMDRLLLWRPADSGTAWTPRDRREAIQERLALFWRGAWRELWDAAVEGGEMAVSSRRKSFTDKQKAAKVETPLAENELGKALKTVIQAGGPNSDSERLADLQALFPEARLADAVVGGQAQWTPEFEKVVEEAIAARLQRVPRGSGAGPDGSRYEHWGGDKQVDVHVGPAALCMRLWAQGKAPAFA